MENDDEKIPYFGLWSDLRKNYLKAEKPAEYEQLAQLSFKEQDIPQVLAEIQKTTRSFLMPCNEPFSNRE